MCQIMDTSLRVRGAECVCDYTPVCLNTHKLSALHVGSPAFTSVAAYFTSFLFSESDFVNVDPWRKD